MTRNGLCVKSICWWRRLYQILKYYSTAGTWRSIIGKRCSCASFSVKYFNRSRFDQPNIGISFVDMWIRFKFSGLVVQTEPATVGGFGTNAHPTWHSDNCILLCERGSAASGWPLLCISSTLRCCSSIGHDGEATNALSPRRLSRQNSGEGQLIPEADEPREHTIDCGDVVWGLAFGSSVPEKQSRCVNIEWHRFKFGQDQLLLATGLNNGRIKIWDVYTGMDTFQFPSIHYLIFTLRNSILIREKRGTSNKPQKQAYFEGLKFNWRCLNSTWLKADVPNAVLFCQCESSKLCIGLKLKRNTLKYILHCL